MIFFFSGEGRIYYLQQIRRMFAFPKQGLFFVYDFEKLLGIEVNISSWETSKNIFLKETKEYGMEKVLMDELSQAR